MFLTINDNGSLKTNIKSTAFSCGQKNAGIAKVDLFNESVFCPGNCALQKKNSLPAAL